MIKTEEPAVVIRVRDRRQKHQFSIHNRVIDEWLPIIGLHGYALYSLYVRMANQTDERCYPGYTTISQHLGIGTTTISNHNRLLVWCGLIHIEPGNRKASNDYYILDIPKVTSEALDSIRQAAMTDLSEKSKFHRTVLNRLDNWQSIQDIWARHRKLSVQVVHPDQMNLPLDVGTPSAEQGTPPAEHGTPPAEHGTPPAEHGTPPGGVEQSETTIRSNNPKQQSNNNTVAVVELLSTFGVTEPALSNPVILDAHPTDVRAWIWYAQTQGNLKDPRAFVISKLRKRQNPPLKFRLLAGLPQETITWLEEHWHLQGYLGGRSDADIDFPAGLDSELAQLWYQIHQQKQRPAPHRRFPNDV